MNKKTNKLISILTLLLLVISTLLPMQANVSAASPTLADGEYEIGFTFLKNGTADVSVLDDYTEKPATLLVEDGKVDVELTLTNSNWIQYLKLGTDEENGEDVEIITEDVENNKRVVGFEVADLSEKIDFYTHVVVTGIPGFEYDNKYNVQLKFDIDSLVKVGEPIDPEEPSESTIEDGEYTINFRALHATEDKDSSMAGWILNPAKLVVEDSKNYVYLAIQEKPGQYLTDIRLEKEGEFVSQEIISEDEESLQRVIKFEVPQLGMVNAEVDMHVVAANYQNTQKFRMNFDVDTVKPVDSTDPEEPSESTIEDGEYTINFRALHATEDKDSSMAGWILNPAKLVVEDSKNYVYLTIQEKPGQYLTDIRLEKEGEFVSQEIINEDEESLQRVIKFEVPQLSMVNAEVDMHVVAANYQNTQKFRIDFDVDTIKPVDPTDPEEPSEPILKNGEYTIDFTALQAGNDEISSADKRFGKPAKLTVKEGKKLISFSVKDSSTIVSLKVEKDGDLVEVETISEDEEEDTRFIQFEVGSLVEELNANVHVVVPELDFESSPDFRIVFDVDSIHLVKEDIDEEPGENPDSGNENPGTNPNPKPEKPSEELFTINVKVLKDGTNAVSVMDQYINKPAELKVKDGRNYISLTLLNSSWIKEFKVEGSSPKVISESSKANTRVVQFEVSDLSKKLNATTHVVIPESEFPGAGSYDERYTVQIEFDPSSKKPLKGSIPTPPTPTSPEKPTPPKAIKGADGGKVEESGASIEFPKEVFGSDFNVTIQKISNLSNLPLEDKQFFAGDVLEITKDKAGDFKKVVTITLPFDKTKVDTKKHELGLYWFNETTKKWIKLDHIKVDLNAGKVSGEVNHFTKFAVLATEKTEDSEQPEQPEQTIRFKDVNDHWAEEQIYSLIKLGAINGYLNGEFRPNHHITRAEFATILVKAFDLNIITGSKFADTKNHWANDYIITAEANGIINGYNDQSFGPNDLLTREQMAVMVVRAKEIKGNKASFTFKDADQIAPWAKEAVEAAVDAKVITGYPNQTFKPKGNATRAEAVTVVVKALN